MTFNEFIKAITPEQVNSWWETIAPTKAPKKVEEENWKYKLSKNGKILPFKFTISELANSYNLDFKSKDFSSNPTNRDVFCEAFDFEIVEDLVYDNTEAINFKEFYSKRVSNKKLFQSFLTYTNAVIIESNVNPYKIRMALTADRKKATIILGMRAVLQYTEENGNPIIGFILNNNFVESLKEFESIYPYKGSDSSKTFVTFQVNHWEDIQQRILNNNLVAFQEQYDSIKNTKRVSWNTEANTTNSVLKYLVFNNMDVEEWIKNNEYKRKQESDIINVKEAFVNWLIANDGGESNYFSLQFGSNKNRLITEIDDYEKIYRDNFNSELFKLKSTDFINDIEIIKSNIYNKNNPFYKFSKEKSNGRPMAILGKKNYLSFLNEYFKNKVLNKPETNKTMSLNQILYGPPGTGKTFATKELAVKIINEAFFKKLDQNLSDEDKRKAIIKEYDRLFELGQIVFTTFHQSMSYEDFVEGIKPIAPTSENSTINYKVENGIFKNLCRTASEVKSSSNFEEAFSLFVNDVLESGTIELTSLIQKRPFNVRINSNETAVAIPKTEVATEMSITKEMIREYVVNGVIKDWKTYTTAIGEYLKANYNISVENSDNTKTNYVLIIDEINRGNVSSIFGELITLLEEDKRIGEKEQILLELPYSKNEKFGVPSNVYIIGTMNTADRSVEALDTALRRRFSFTEVMPNPKVLKGKKVSEIALDKLLETINKRIEVLLDRDHTIGHSYFIKIENDAVEDLKMVFKNNIIPLLQEYFYGDYEKIGMVLGQGFVKKTNTDDVTFPEFIKNNYYKTTRYDLIPIDNDFKIIDAINQLWR